MKNQGSHKIWKTWLIPVSIRKEMHRMNQQIFSLLQLDANLIEGEPYNRLAL